MNLRLSLSPHGRLSCDVADQKITDSPGTHSPLNDQSVASVQHAFAISSAEGLWVLGGPTIREVLPAELVFWRDWARRLFQAVCHLDEEQQVAFMQAALKTVPALIPPPNALDLAALIAEAPPMRGLEYLTPAVLQQLWSELVTLVRTSADSIAGGLTALLKTVNPVYQQLGRVTFHLAENKRDESRPFAFLATYAHRLSAKSSVQHLPLAQALKQFAGEQDRTKLAELLVPVRQAADGSSLVRGWLASRALFQPQSLSIAEAYQFLRDVPIMEQSGLVVRVPNWWRPRNPPRPSVRVHLGEKEPSRMGIDGLLDFSVDLALDGEALSAAEQRALLATTEGLLLLRGKWVEVNRDQLTQALSHWQELQHAHAGGIDFLQGMRLLAGAVIDGDDQSTEGVAEWMNVSAGTWLRDSLAQLRDPSGVVGCTPGEGLQATLRPYQVDGVKWLWFMTRLGLGACLADDMGLGKTIQIIDLLLRIQGTQTAKGTGTASLLVVPASLIGNWKQELARFAPQLRVLLLHRSECDADTLARAAKNPSQEFAGVDLVVTTYTLVRKAEWIAATSWRLVILDEAQAIKNAGSAQTKSVKKITAVGRIALTGTPVENQLGDLWSLFDFCCPGLLGSAKQFKGFVKRLNQKQDAQAYGSLRRLVQPYILRRMKTDPNIVPDLPDKTEMRVDCGLSKKQAALYQQVVEELARQLKEVDGIQRRGIVLATMMRLKQICNHPAQYLDQPEFESVDSAKFMRLGAICESIAERQEKVLVFTQFQSLCEPLAKYLGEEVFGLPGLVLHGGVPVRKRQDLVQRFQNEDAVPFFVISVKAGGTGLNLTAASHVVHFDRWWNPAVENQATDRAFRIGQKRNVLVHKFVCRGTLEERIDEMLRDKQDLADKILGPTREGETLLTEMSDKELLKFVALDITRAAEEG